MPRPGTISGDSRGNMIKIFTTGNMVALNHAKTLLQDHGIPFLVKNENPVGAAAGEVPPIVCWPELWVHEGEAGAKALDLLQHFQAGSDLRAAPWTCGQCGEIVESQFSACWRCGADRSPASDQDR